MQENEQLIHDAGRTAGILEALCKTVERIEAKQDTFIEKQDEHSKEIERMKTAAKVLHAVALGLAGFTGWLAGFFHLKSGQ